MKVVDCRVCGDPNSVLRFAFVEFTDEGMFISFSLDQLLLVFGFMTTYKFSIMSSRRCKKCFKSGRNYAWILSCAGAAF